MTSLLASWRSRTGDPATSRMATVGIRTSHGRRITQVARRCQAPSPNGLGWRMGIRMLLIRRPRIASIAGSSVTP